MADEFDTFIQEFLENHVIQEGYAVGPSYNDAKNKLSNPEKRLEVLNRNITEEEYLQGLGELGRDLLRHAVSKEDPSAIVELLHYPLVRNSLLFDNLRYEWPGGKIPDSYNGDLALTFLMHYPKSTTFYDNEFEKKLDKLADDIANAKGKFFANANKKAFDESKPFLPKEIVKKIQGQAKENLDIDGVAVIQNWVEEEKNKHDESKQASNKRKKR